MVQEPTNDDDLNKLNEQETRIQAWEIAPTLYNHPQGQQNILEWHLSQSFAQGYYTIEE